MVSLSRAIFVACRGRSLMIDDKVIELLWLACAYTWEDLDE